MVGLGTIAGILVGRIRSVYASIWRSLCCGITNMLYPW